MIACAFALALVLAFVLRRLLQRAPPEPVLSVE